jgi:LPXTG-motif cell wall-anchored protein
MRSSTRRTLGIATTALGFALAFAGAPGDARADQGVDNDPTTVFLKADQVGDTSAEHQGVTDPGGACADYDSTEVLWHFTSGPLTDSGALTGTLTAVFANDQTFTALIPSAMSSNVFHWTLATSEPTAIVSAVATYSEAQVHQSVDLRLSHTCAPQEQDLCEPTTENNQCSPCPEGDVADGQGGCSTPCEPTTENNQCSPCPQGDVADGQGGCTTPCVPTEANNLCSPCPEGDVADGLGGCSTPCVPTEANNLCTPCEQGTPDGAGGCDIDLCDDAKADCTTGGDPDPDPEIVVPIIETEPLVAATEVVAVAVPEPAPVVEEAVAPAALPTEVAGVQLAELPRTGSSTMSLLALAAGLLVVGGLLLFGSTLPAVARRRIL